MSDPGAFLLAISALLFAPGPTNAVMAAAGSDRGASAIKLLAAELAGYGSGIAAGGLLLLPAIDAWPPAGIVLKLVVAAWLVFAGWRLWRAGGAETGRKGAAWQAFVVTALNPKCLVLALAVLPWEQATLAGYLAALAAVVVASGATWFLLGRAIAALARSRAHLVPRVGAAVLFGFAAWLAGTAS
jgi:threonine/homoserine/homoserine lactone efflux protein